MPWPTCCSATTIPAGRLPITFPVAEGQLPLVYNHKPTGRGDDYLDLTGQPLFPFGYGLSYTTFEYGDLAIGQPSMQRRRTPRPCAARCGTPAAMAGDEVVQLYLRDELASVARPVMELKGFARVRLEPGEARDGGVRDHARRCSRCSTSDLAPVVEPGDVRVMIGASSKDIRLRGLPDAGPLRAGRAFSSRARSGARRPRRRRPDGPSRPPDSTSLPDHPCRAKSPRDPPPRRHPWPGR